MKRMVKSGIIINSVCLRIPVLALMLLAMSSSQAVSSDIVINEIMYHPPNDHESEEFVELYNCGKTPVDLSGWSFTKGISYTFPGVTIIKPGGYLVIYRSRDGFRAVYGEGITALGEFTKTLSNGGETVALSDSAGNIIDSVKYDDRPPWPVGPDGCSASLERICPYAENEPWNWASSPLPAGEPRPAGTPGRQNSCYSLKPLPVVSDIEFSPVNPAPEKPVTIKAKVTGGSEVFLLYRVVKSGYEGEEIELPMKPISGDCYEAAVPGQPDRSIVRFRIRAAGVNGTVRFQPHQNALRPAYSYFTYSNKDRATIPIGFIINTEAGSYQSARRNEQQRRQFVQRQDENLPFRMELPEPGRPGPGPWPGGPPGGGPLFPGMRRPGSDSEPPPRGSAAFVYVSPNAGNYQIYDYVSVVPRTGGYKVRFHNDQPLNGMTTVNIIFEFMPRFVLAEHLSYEVYRRAGVPAEYSEYVRIYIDDHLLGYHLLVEQPNRNFLRRNNRDDTGNLYKLLWYEEGVIRQHEKKTNTHTGHEDVVDLVAALEKTSGEKQWEVIQKHFNVEEIASYFAVSICLSNWDGFWNNYFTYHDMNGSGKWEIYPWDEDKTWGYYDGASPRDYLYDMPLDFGMDEPPLWPWQGKTIKGGPNWGRPGKPSWWRPAGYFSGPILANKYFRELFLIRLKDITETVFNEAVFLPIIDEMERKLEPEVRIRASANGQNVNNVVRNFNNACQSLRDHLTKRRNYILGQKEIKEIKPGKKVKLPPGLSG